MPGGTLENTCVIVHFISLLAYTLTGILSTPSLIILTFISDWSVSFQIAYQFIISWYWVLSHILLSRNKWMDPSSRPACQKGPDSGSSLENRLEYLSCENSWTISVWVQFLAQICPALKIPLSGNFKSFKYNQLVFNSPPFNNLLSNHLRGN